MKAGSYRHVRDGRASLKRASLGCLAALPFFLAGQALADTPDGELRILSLNTWMDRFSHDPSLLSEFLIEGDYDVLTFQEARQNGTYLDQLPGLLKEAGLGDYTTSQVEDLGVMSRPEGEHGQYVEDGSVGYIALDAEGGVPDITVGTVHFNYYDDDSIRVREARSINEWKRGVDQPIILTGDFNAGDVSERGLHSVDQQKLLLRSYLRNNNGFYYELLSQYANDQQALDAFIERHRGQSVDDDIIPDGLFSPETYPIAGNTPRTVNILKKEFMLLQSDTEREPWRPHEPGDGSATWPSESEQTENKWSSWDFTRIDHFMVSRPFGKWFALADDPNDPYLGVLDDTDVADNGVPLSDHAPLAHNVKWVGPELERFELEGNTETRLIWGEGAPVFEDRDGVFYLTRNNQRDDIYLGQIADEWGNPILTDLTLEEKRTRLDCGSSDPRFQQAIADYCIDDHSFISETLVTDGGTLIVDEDAALGGSDAALRLNDGGLRIAGTGMMSLDREVSLEGEQGGFIEVAEAQHRVTLAREVSGGGAFEKRGQGALVLEGDNTYTGETRVSEGLLAVDGSIAASSHTRVAEGGILGGSGRVGDLTIESGGTLSPGRSIGTLHVEGDLRFEEEAIYQVEVDAAGYADRVAASGEIRIDGGSVLALAANGHYALATDYRLLTAQEGVSGEFDAVSSSLAFLAPSLRYGEQDVTLRMERNDTAFEQVALSPNRQASARGVESLGMGNGLYDAVATLDSETADAAFGQLSGELHAGLQGALVDESHLLRQAVTSRLAGSGDGQRILTAGETGVTSWWQGIGNWGRSDAGEGRDLARDTQGFLIGADGRVGDAGRLGVLAGYGSTDYDGDSMLGTADADSYHLGIYGGARLGDVDLSLGASHSRSSIETERSVAFASVDEQLMAKYDGETTQVFGEVRYPLSFGEVHLEPFAGLAQVRVSRDGFQESGGVAALTGEAQDLDATFSSLGARVAMPFTMADHSAVLRADAAWLHVLDSDIAKEGLAFDGGDPFTVTGMPLADDTAELGASLEVGVAANASLSLGYRGRLGGELDDHGVNATLNVSF
ncbi:autotransporter domain-containing protein [Halomonas pacifica]|uniref:autotransporter domain-containing protein n=1 Tax=Bisbaumannia pacifica TaxID=77098 RepID=UPI002359365D|nr:autotransporter domain-containing protein [Halomonas pacifica]MDC8802039.1 autotransporter domain-containing protein [Halomonas pacifica]